MLFLGHFDPNNSESLSKEQLIFSTAAKLQSFIVILPADENKNWIYDWLKEAELQKKALEGLNSWPYVKSNGQAIHMSYEHIAPIGNENKTFKNQLL